MEETAFVAGLAEVQIVAVLGERKRNDGLGRRSDDLGVAAGRNVAEPEAVETVIAHGDEQEFSVGRDGGAEGFAGSGGRGDGILGEGAWGFGREERTEHKSRGDEQCEYDDGGEQCGVSQAALCWDGWRNGGTLWRGVSSGAGAPMSWKRVA